MLIIPLLVGLLVYLVVFLVARAVFLSLRTRDRYFAIWSIALTATGVWLAVLAATSGGRIQQLLAMTVANPNEDFWGMKFIGLVITFFLALPMPVALAAIWVRPVGTWWANKAVRVSFAVGVILLILLHISFRGVCHVTILDQFGNPVPDVKLAYYLDGLTVRKSDASGRVLIPFYRGVHRLDITDTMAGGYEIDYRQSSHRPYDPMPAEVALPAWKILRVPQLLLTRPNIEIITDGRPYSINLLREEASATHLPITDLEIRIIGPQEPPRAAPGKFQPEPYSWSIDIRCLRGGMQEAPQGYQYLAPLDHYQEVFAHTMSPGDKDWNSSFQQMFYLRLRDGKAFAVAEITVTTLSDAKRRIFVDAKINPAADRNLFWGYGNLLGLSQNETKPWLTALFGNEY